MSSIPKIIALKGERDFIPLYSGKDEYYCMVVEGGGKYKGFDYIITFNEHGYRSAYIAIDKDLDFDESKILCHGGITHKDRFHLAKELLDEYFDELWIGFDAAHSGDSPCLSTCKKYFCFMDPKRNSLLSASEEKSKNKKGIHRDYHFMENQCHLIINQLIEMGLSP